MAIDVYLQIDGIKGESQDSAHPGRIELSSAHWRVTQPRSATASTGSGQTAERCEHRTLKLSKTADLASPILMQYCLREKSIPKAKLDFMRADSDGKPVKYYQIELENVLIASIDQMIHGGSILHDEIGLRFPRSSGHTCSRKLVAAPAVPQSAAGTLLPTKSREAEHGNHKSGTERRCQFL